MATKRNFGNVRVGVGIETYRDTPANRKRLAKIKKVRVIAAQQKRSVRSAVIRKRAGK